MVDSGRGKTLIGRDTLQQLESLVAKCGFGPIKLRDENNVFRFGNGMTEKSSQVAVLPVGIAKAKVFGTIDAAVIAGQAPLLLGRPTLVKMGVSLDFKNNQMAFMNHQATMQVNNAGQLLVNVLDYPPKPVPQARPQVAVHNAGDKSGDNHHGVSNEELRHKTKITLKKRRNADAS